MLNKLKNKQGVTILMALLFLVLAVVISCVVLTAVITAMHTVRDDRQQQQAYLNVSSAVQLLKKEIAAIELQYKKVEIKDPNKNVIETTVTQTVTAAPASLETLLEDMLDSVSVDDPQTREFKIVVNRNETATINVSMTVSYAQSNEGRYVYWIEAVVSNADEDYPSEVVLTMRSSDQQAVINTSGQVTTTTINYIWIEENAVISKVEKEGAG